MDKVEMSMNDYRAIMAYVQALEQINQLMPIVGKITTGIQQKILKQNEK